MHINLKRFDYIIDLYLFATFFSYLSLYLYCLSSILKVLLGTLYTPTPRIINPNPKIILPNVVSNMPVCGTSPSGSSSCGGAISQSAVICAVAITLSEPIGVRVTTFE